LSNTDAVHYLSDKEGLQITMEKTGLKEKDLERIVGRFGRQSAQYNQLRGKLVVTPDGKVEIRDQWNCRVYWRKDIRKRKPRV
jgi:hypothetical protein